MAVRTVVVPVAVRVRGMIVAADTGVASRRLRMSLRRVAHRSFRMAEGLAARPRTVRRRAAPYRLPSFFAFLSSQATSS
jgi:hypothetical protein